MKRYIVKTWLKKITAGMLASALVLSGISCLSENCESVQAADTTKFHTESMEVSDYISGDTRLAPKPKDSGYADWIFAGWYEDDSCEKSFKGTSGNKTAKFVPAEVLSVRCQVLSGTEATSGSSSMRIVSSVDSLMYSEVGFVISLGNVTKSFRYQKVCSSVAATEGGVPYDYAPSDFHSMAEYFITVTMTNISQERFDAGFYIRPYWKTLDGTTVYGVDRYARVEDSYLKIVNVPVRLYSDVEVAAGYLEVSYDTDTFTYYPNTDGSYDTGLVFTEAEVAADSTSSVVRCVGNVGDIDNKVKADGLYLNLRFQVKKDKDIPDSAEFAVGAEAFCDIAEKDVAIDVSDMEFKQIKKSTE